MTDMEKMLIQGSKMNKRNNYVQFRFFISGSHLFHMCRGPDVVQDILTKSISEYVLTAWVIIAKSSYMCRLTENWSRNQSGRLKFVVNENLL